MKRRKQVVKLERRRAGFKAITKITQGPSEFHEPGSLKK